MGYGTFDLTIDTLEKAATGKSHCRTGSARRTCISRLMINFLTMFGMLEPRPALYGECRRADRSPGLSAR